MRMNKRLPVGTEFWTTLGPRRIVYRGERHYFQKDPTSLFVRGNTGA